MAEVLAQSDAGARRVVRGAKNQPELIEDRERARPLDGVGSSMMMPREMES